MIDTAPAPDLPPVATNDPTPAQAAYGADQSYQSVIQTLVRDTVADSNMVQDLQRQQAQLLQQQNTVANQVLRLHHPRPDPRPATSCEPPIGVGAHTYTPRRVNSFLHCITSLHRILHRGLVNTICQSCETSGATLHTPANNRQILCTVKYPLPVCATHPSVCPVSHAQPK